MLFNFDFNEKRIETKPLGNEIILLVIAIIMVFIGVSMSVEIEKYKVNYQVNTVMNAIEARQVSTVKER